ncbi:DUF3084 domain-containing protein [Alkalinema sp. FACHB-956]|uniref:DUF3084 domain-containing protein n=1 Tax=Alkalinema sp. FACHB-956 TaxID=2692768 RepID=UPI001683D613|nr:DUF3084 domain-containing protein [Alkalinema sp. FACHB-956]MBD2327501.1 DUF3084 domain-containing protein [Alkalinema sp. FACHB-956]
MSSGYILILAVLILGGVIATLGDRIGTRVGKARLSLFNLRPKKTAVVVTILTGILISASTLGILLLANRQFRDMILNFEVIQRRLRRASTDLDQAKAELGKTAEQKENVEAELNKSQVERGKVQAQLDRVKNSLKDAAALQRATEARRAQVEQQRNVVQAQLLSVSQQALALKSEILELEAEQKQLAAQRDEVKAQIAARDQEIEERSKIIQQRDRDIAARDTVITQREERLRALENQQVALAREVEKLEQEAQRLRLGTPAILRNQVLASGVVRITNPQASNQAVDALLREANRVAQGALQPGVDGNGQILRITRSEVDQLARQISDGRDYFVRILAAANYLLGEKTEVTVFADVVRNEVIYRPGDVLATTSLDPSKMTVTEIQDRINKLVAASIFRAKRAGLLSDNVQVSRIQALIQFIDGLRQYDSSIEIRAIAGDVTYTAGPMRLELIAVQNGQTVLQTSR